LLPRCVKLVVEGSVRFADGRVQVAAGHDAELAVGAW
jgi:TolB-like protein